ncbi:carbohydrate kinase family protein [Streptomyces sp.]|uniref:carbohydrate kinase family protein n=1 Tax=Streptomyces sp. TaxID=1931 RepID=UPI002F41D0BB
MITVIGEALVDLVPAPGGNLTPCPGGGPYNAARTMARLGRPVRFAGRLSTDGFGALLRARLGEDGVEVPAALATPAPTTLALAGIADDGSASYTFYTDGTSAPALDAARLRQALGAVDGALHVGSLGLVLEPMATAVEEAVLGAAATTLVFLDPNCRPALIDDPAAYRDRITRVRRRADVVKASDEDLRWLRPGRDPLATARDLLAEGPAAVLLTRGAAGVTVVSGSGVQEVPAPKAEVVDTVGAGDAFGGAFLAWWTHHGLGRADLHRPDLLRAAATFACTVAARTCEVAGAQPPRLAQLAQGF